MIYFDRVSKKYGKGSAALEEVTFTIQPHEFVTIVGHSGAGKTTLLKMILGEDKPTSGGVFFHSKNIHKLPRRKIPEFRRKIGTVFQDFRLLPRKTAFENVAFAMEVAGKSDEEIAADVPHVLDLVGLNSKGSHFPNQLSGGEQQRVAIARAIVNQPDVIIADEPTGNLDPISTYDIVQLLRKINELETTVILTTHNKGVVDTVGGRVLTMEQGKIIRDDPNGRYVL